MQVRNIGPDTRLVPALGLAVAPGQTVEAGQEWAAGALPQVWYWEAACEASRALRQPQWWSHPYVAEVEAGGGAVAARPEPPPPTAGTTTKTGGAR